MESPLALYRRYRPETFAEVIGQEHVTEPLRAALAHNRVNHAYLFSGPRGCGKTTSARILARSLNCAQAPVADPCGECDSCRDLARGGSGSIDVIEIDAASHNGVDDARDLREKAFFAPVRDPYKVYIIDEAHMVTTQAFNALLKLVEEPPPHLRFIFATTEPDKVLPTIRSRTHHYPFRLIPPRLLTGYLTELCGREQVAIEQAALPLVVRAGAGSARDTLSVLDQLIGGSGPDGVTYQLASGLLGYTPDTLLDEVVDAFAGGDGGTVFGVVDKVIETGQDPRRFTEDLLRRLRDLVIIAAVPEAPATGLIELAEDQADRLVAQANRFGRRELTRAADLVAAGLTEMRGATAPRLLLELICARILLPGADHTSEGLLARLDRLERRVAIAGTPAPAEPAAQVERAAPTERAAATERAAPTEPPGPATEPAATAPAAATPTTVPPPAPAAEPAASPAAPAAAAPPPAAPAALGLVDVRRLWPDIVEAVRVRRRVAWIHLTQHAQVIGVEGAVVTLGFNNPGARDSFVNSGSAEIVRQTAIDVVGYDWRIEAINDPGADPSVAAPAGDAPAAAPVAPPADPVPGDRTVAVPAEPVPAEPAPAEAPDIRAAAAPPVDPAVVAAAREAITPTRTPGAPPPADPGPTPDDDVDPDDPETDSLGLGGAALLQRELGAQVIEEIPHE